LLEVDGAEGQRLLVVIAASDEILAAEGGSADPVAQRHVVGALARKARALGELGRYDGRVALWDEMVRLFADDPPAGRPLIVLQARAAKAADLLLAGRPAVAVEVAAALVDSCDEQDQSDAVCRLAARTLAIKRDALVRMGREDDALRVDEEIIDRCFEVEDLELRGQVNRALSFKSQALWRADRVEDALEVSQLMVGRLASEPNPGLLESGATVINDLTRLMAIGGPSMQGIAWTVLVAATNSAYQAVRATTAWLPATDSIRVLSQVEAGIKPLIGIIQSLARAAVPERLTYSRRRLAQALAGSQAVIARLDGSDDPDLQEMAAVAQIVQGIALCVLGHPVAGKHALDLVSSGHKPSGIQAWQRLAATFARGEHTLDQVGAISALALRAQALGAGDRGIAQIAYDDSLHDHGVAGRSTIVDLIARGLRPTTKRKPSR
jgi:hypothetical protein